MPMGAGPGVGMLANMKPAVPPNAGGAGVLPPNPMMRPPAPGQGGGFNLANLLGGLGTGYSGLGQKPTDTAGIIGALLGGVGNVGMTLGGYGTPNVGANYFQQQLMNMLMTPRKSEQQIVRMTDKQGNPVARSSGNPGGMPALGGLSAPGGMPALGGGGPMGIGTMSPFFGMPGLGQQQTQQSAAQAALAASTMTPRILR